MITRCDWSASDEKMLEYHDKEWGTPVRDERLLFEHLLLDCFQAGLSWQTILNKRENFRLAFDNFEPEKIAVYGEDKIKDLLNNPGIIRNKLKINAAIKNARAYLEIKEEFGSFSDFIWKFCNHKTIVNSRVTWKDMPATSIESDEMSKELKKRGFSFVGSTICYAFMQAVGMVNDHTITCFRYRELQKNKLNAKKA
jgi:DNA-3-methyladenine glycosylase I